VLIFFVGERQFSVVFGIYVFGRRDEAMASKANNETSAIALASGLGSTAPVFSDDEVLLLLRAAIEREGGQAAFESRHGVDRVYLNMVLNGGRPVGSTIVKALGLRKGYVAASTPAGCDNLRTTLHPTPWSVEESPACFAVRDHNGQVVTCVYFEVEPRRRSVVTLFTRDEAEHIAAAVAKLPELSALRNKSTA
jgi:hypothetical protein